MNQLIETGVHDVYEAALRIKKVQELIDRTQPESLRASMSSNLGEALALLSNIGDTFHKLDSPAAK